MYRTVVTIAIAILFTALPVNSIAHKVGLFAYEEAGLIYTEAYFVDGTACRNSKITAYDAEGSVVAEGYTNSEGLYTFPHSGTGDLRIVLRADMGHGNEILLRTGETDTGHRSSKMERTEGDNRDSKTDFNKDAYIDEAILERIMEAKIAPIRNSVKEIQKGLERPSLGKILGGLGWIVGIAGAYLWGVSTRKDRVKVKGEREKNV